MNNLIRAASFHLFFVFALCTSNYPRQLGEYFGRMSSLLRETDVEATHRTFAWDLCGLPRIRSFAAFASEDRKPVLESVIATFEADVLPRAGYFFCL